MTIIIIIIINRATNYVYNPWKDDTDGDNIFFASVHGYGKLDTATNYFYPGSGQHQNRVTYVAEETMGMKYPKPTIVDAYVTKEQGRIAYFWREQFRTQILPRLLEFKPDLIFISAGRILQTQSINQTMICRF